MLHFYGTKLVLIDDLRSSSGQLFTEKHRPNHLLTSIAYHLQSSIGPMIYGALAPDNLRNRNDPIVYGIVAANA